jgi:hypothetical protein
LDNFCLFGRGAGVGVKVVLGKEKVHLGIITRNDDARLWSGLVLDYSFIGCFYAPKLTIRWVTIFMSKGVKISM